VRFYYYMWQLGAYFVTRRLHRKVNFDIAHHVTFVKYSSPTFLAFLPIPFLWGPVGGGESSPAAFRKRLGIRERALEVLRDLSHRVGESDPLVRMAARRAVLALATTDDTAKRLAIMGCKNVRVMSAVGLSAPELALLGRIPCHEGRPFRIVTVGRVLYWKGCELALRAFAEFKKKFPDSEYWIIGEGADRTRLERLSHSLSLGKNVVFLGQLSRGEVFDKMARCDVMLFPSLHDSGGWVCLEAMAARRPVVCLDLGGPGLQVAPEVGIKIPALTPAQAVEDIADALWELATSSAKRLQLGERGRLRVQRSFHWDMKGEEIAALYSCLASTTR
jgi:glycosyltransferase involved in cell wall biosynthesis